MLPGARSAGAEEPGSASWAELVSRVAVAGRGGATPGGGGARRGERKTVGGAMREEQHDQQQRRLELPRHGPQTVVRTLYCVSPSGVQEDYVPVQQLVA